MDARTGRRLGIHASALLVVYGERRSTLFHGGAHDVWSSGVSTRPHDSRNSARLPHDVWSCPVRSGISTSSAHTNQRGPH